MWHKNAVIYSLDVETFMDSDGDGIGDFRGLIGRLDHLENLGVTCVWLQPFHPSPNLDDGYDVTDYYAVDSRLGSLGDFAELSFQLRQRGIRLMMDLVVNHTSDQHPWFQQACRDRNSRFRDFYVWSAERPANADQGMVFPGPQESTWTWSEPAGAWYFHRFYKHQPDLNIANPEVRREILDVMGYWLQLGVSGFRVDAAPFLIELVGHDQPKDEAMYGFLEEMRDLVSWRSTDAVLLAEANVSREKIAEYFGDGDRMHMLFSFLVNQPLFLSLARGHCGPLREALEHLPPIPTKSQWAQFLRGHDELDLGRLSDAERQEVYAAFGPEPCMQLYGRGIRRRLAPMFGHDQRRIELAHSLMFTLPGSQVIRYGDEIGMDDDLALNERLAVRTPMQWDDDANGGFSSAPAERLIRPVIRGERCGYERINVRSQLRDPGSLLNRVARLIRARRSCPEIGCGTLSLLAVDDPAVLAHVCDWNGRRLLALHNLGAEPRRIRLSGTSGWRLFELIGDQAYPNPAECADLGGYGYRWFRVGGLQQCVENDHPA